MPAGLAAQQRRLHDFLGRPVAPWEWQSTRAEDEVTTGIWALLNPPRDPLLATRATEAFLSVLPAALGSYLSGFGPLRGWILEGNFGPDLLLADSDNVVRIVVEHKRGAPAQVTALSTVTRTGGLFSEPLARYTWAEVTRHHVATPHHPTSGDLNDFDCCWAHTLPSRTTGRVSAGMWQIDAYRCTPGWAYGTMLTVPADPGEIGWVFLDARGRRAADVYEASPTAMEWHTLSHAQLAERLLDWLIDEAASPQAYPHEASPLGQQAGDALRMLFTDGPSARDRWRT